MEGLDSAAGLVDLMMFLVNTKLLNTHTGVGALHKALKDIVDGSYTNLLTPEQRAAAQDCLLQPYPAVLQLLLGVENMDAYLRRMFTSAGFPGLLDSLLHTPDMWPAVEEALA
jgi:hypothetical protein